MSVSARDLVEAAERLTATPPEGSVSQAWARGAALLLRQAIETSLNSVWRAKAPELGHAQFSVQLTCFREFTADKELAAETKRTWHVLSSFCHFRGFGMPPSPESLSVWTERVRRLVDAIEPAE